MATSHENVSGGMREEHIKHINAHLPQLIEWTNLTSMTLAIFTQSGILAPGDLSQLKSIPNDHDRNDKFYTIIQTRLNFFEVLLKAMDATNQTGVLDLLKKFTVNSETSRLSISTRKYARVPAGLKIFVDSASKPICIVASIDMKITLEKIKENLQGICHVHECLTDFLKTVSSQVGEVGEQAISSCHQVVPVEGFQDLKNTIDGTLKLDTPVKLVLVTVHENYMLLQDFTQRYPSWANVVQISEDTMEWHDLSLAYKQHISIRLTERYNINLQVELDTLLQGDVLVKLIHGNELSLFKVTTPKPLDYYIGRVIRTRNVISEDIFTLDRDDDRSGIFLLTGIKRSELSMLRKREVTRGTRQIVFTIIQTYLQYIQTFTSQIYLNHPYNVFPKFLIQDNPLHFDRIGWNVHLLHRDATDRRLRWQKTSGYIHRVQKFIDSTQDELNEEEFIRHFKPDSNLPVCIPDSPGMGKSVLLAQIARMLLIQHPEREIIFLNVTQFISQISEKESTDSVVKAVENLICENGLAKAVLRQKFGSTDTVLIELLLDGFDELDAESCDQALGIISKIVTSFKSVRLWVTSRRHFLTELEEAITVLGYTISPFSDEDQVNFLKAYWTSNNPNLDPDSLEKFSRECLREVNTGFSSAYKDIAGIPLQCRLIGEVFENAAVEYSEAGGNAEHASTTVEVRSIRHLFEKTIENRFKKYESLNENNKITWEEVMNSHCRAALKFLFPEYLCRMESLFKAVQPDEILKVGILEASSNLQNDPQFVHRTYAEYFVAWFLVSMLSNSDSSAEVTCVAKSDVHETLNKFLFEEVLSCTASKLKEGQPTTGPRQHYAFKHSVIAHFLDSLLDLEATKINLPKILYQPSLTLETMEQLTRACAHASLVQIFKFLLDLIISNSSEDLSKIFDKDFLFLTIKKSSFEFVELALDEFEIYHAFGPDLEMEVLRMAAARGDFSIMGILLNQRQLYKLVEEGKAQQLLHECIQLTKFNSELELSERIEICKTLVGFNESILKEINKRGTTPLLLADVHVRLMVSLIDLGADVLVTDELGDTIIHMNKEERQFTNEEYHTLLTNISKGKLKRLIDFKGAGGDLPLVRMLKQIDPSPEVLRIFKEAGFNFNYTGPDNYSLLAIAVKFGRNEETLQCLIDLGDDIDWELGGSPLLHICVEFGNADAIRVLSKHEDFWIFVSMKNNARFDALELALKWNEFPNRFETGKLIFEEGGIIRQKVYDSKNTWLHIYSQQGDIESVKLLLHCGFDASCVDEGGNTPLHCAVMGLSAPQLNYYAICQLLLYNGANPNRRNNEKRTPLEEALMNKHMDLETFKLLKSKTNVEWSGSLATLALKFAMNVAPFLEDDEFYSIVKECADGEANLNCRDKDRNTLLHIAVDRKDETVVRLLIEKGANLDLRNSKRHTPLHRAAQRSFKITNILIDSGANVHQRDIGGSTFLHMFAYRERDPSSSQLEFLVNFLGERNHSELFDSRFIEAVQGNENVLLLVKQFRPDFSTVPVTEPTPESKFKSIVVGTTEFPISKIVFTIKGTDQFNELVSKWPAVARELDMPTGLLRDLSDDHWHGTLSSIDLIYEILEDWVGRKREEATLHELILAFDNCSLAGCTKILTAIGNGASKNEHSKIKKIFNFKTNFHLNVY